MTHSSSQLCSLGVSTLRAEEMAQWLHLLVVLSEDFQFGCQYPWERSETTCKSNSRESHTFFWSLWAQGMHKGAHPHMQAKHRLKNKII